MIAVVVAGAACIVMEQIGIGQTPPSATAPAKKPIYKPPFRGAPAVRVDGGSRGSAEELPTLFVLAPDHTGLTTAAQPSLCWFQSKPAKSKLEITVISDQSPAPLIETNLDGALPQQFRRLSLSQLNVKLAEGTEYQWSLALVPDPDNRSKDVIASGRIRRVAVTPELQAELSRSPEREKHLAYAQAGIWYDAIDSLQNLIERSKDDRELLSQRDALLQQVGLTNLTAIAKP